MGLNEGRKEEGEGEWKEGKGWGSTTCGLRGETERGDIQKTHGKNELGDDVRREVGKGGA